jgi:ubiquinone biosynthesis protein Coq4
MTTLEMLPDLPAGKLGKVYISLIVGELNSCR